MYLKVHNYSDWKRFNVQIASEMPVFKPSEPKIVIRKKPTYEEPCVSRYCRSLNPKLAQRLHDGLSSIFF